MDKSGVILGSRKHPSDFIGQTVTAYPTCGPYRHIRVAIYVDSYVPETGIARIKDLALDTMMEVMDKDWTVLECMDSK